MGCSLLSIIEIFYFLTKGLSSLLKKIRTVKSAQIWAITKVIKDSEVDSVSRIEFLSKTVKKIEKQTNENRKSIHVLMQKVKILEKKRICLEKFKK